MLDDLSTHLAAGALAHPENVLDLLGFEGGDGVGADHAAIGDNAGLADPEALAQALDHWQQLRHVGGIAGHQEGGDRPVGVIEHNAEHDLLQMPTVRKPPFNRANSLLYARLTGALRRGFEVAGSWLNT